MQFMIRSVRRPGVSKKKLIEHFTSRMDPKTWDLIRTGKVAHLYYTLGDEPGFFAIVNADDIEEVKAGAAEATEKHNLFDLEIVPVSIFAEFPAA
jgi:hypothetical protein